MLEHEIKKKVLTIGNRKGQTVYYAYPKSQQKLTHDMVVWCMSVDGCTR